MNRSDVISRAPSGGSPGTASWLGIAGWILLTNPGCFTMVLGPVLMPAFISGSGVNPAQATAFGSAELAGMAIVTFIINFLPIGKVILNNRRAALACALCLALAGQFFTTLGAEFAALVLVRFLVGLGTGCAFALAIAALAMRPNPDRLFGIQMTTNQLSIFVLMTILSLIGSAAVTMTPVYAVMAFTALSLLSIPLLPMGANTAPAAGLAPVTKLDTPPHSIALLATISFFFFNLGIGAFWPLVGQIGLAGGVGSGEIAYALTWATLGAICGGLTAALIGNKASRLAVIVGGSCAMMVIMLLLGRDASATAFGIQVIGLMFLWLLMMPYYLGMLAELDGSGKLASLSGLLLPLGMAVGQALSAIWLISETASGIWMISCSQIIIATFGLLATYWLKSRSRQDT